MRRRYDQRQTLVRDGALLTDAEIVGGDDKTAPQNVTPSPRRTGLPWHVVAGVVRCRDCDDLVRCSLEGTRRRIECRSCCWVATADERRREWVIEERVSDEREPE